MSYRVDYLPPFGVIEGRLLTCSCMFFTLSSSACIHMYFLAREYKLLVVEKVPSRPQPATIETNSNPGCGSANGVINSSNFPQPDSSKRRNSGVFSPCKLNFSKRPRPGRQEYGPFNTAHPTLTAGWSNAPNPVQSHPNHRAIEPMASAEELTPKGIIAAELNSGISALKQISNVLKRKKDRKDMAKLSSPCLMNRFQEVCFALLQMVEDHIPSTTQTVAPMFRGVGDTSSMNGAEAAVLVGEMVEFGWGAFKRMEGLLKVAKNSKMFVSKSDLLSMGL
ncbi:hypothetical protein PtA15_9A523 [Puccinia triticina]|uniref:SWIM-type domain-containing protein n=1 Tax=Puccinia triticina TaxID=208348 RepID=A0ABY7CT22_9BASI|nr:uncharacterized protein PtA15_9A523 [Puccinia triticina]WAQ88396.1 hypothetical protein PtA15_9A523 [Puccinia triticina]